MQTFPIELREMVLYKYIKLLLLNCICKKTTWLKINLVDRVYVQSYIINFTAVYHEKYGKPRYNIEFYTNNECL